MDRDQFIDAELQRLAELQTERERVRRELDADAALQLLESRNDIGILFTDVDMPGSMNGFALAQHVANEHGGRLFADTKANVFVCGHSNSVMYFLPRQFRQVSDPDQADFAVAWTQSGCDHTLIGEVVTSIERFGVPLAVVKDLRK